MFLSPETIEAERLLKAGQRKAAAARLAQAVTRYPNNATAWRMLAEALDDPAQKQYALNRARSLETAQPPAPQPQPPAPVTPVRRVEPSTVRTTAPAPISVDPQPTREPAVPPRLTPLEMVQQREREEAAAAQEQRRRQSSKRWVWILGGASALSMVTVLTLGGAWLLLRPAPAAPRSVSPPIVSPTPAVTVAPTVTPPPYAAAFVEGPCPFQPPANAAVSCGVVAVPEDRARPDSPTLSLAVVVYRSARSNVNTPPLFYLQGGPGADAIGWSASVHASVVAPIVAERDLVVFDQRGTGFSTPKLECPDLHTDDPVAAATACRESLLAAAIDPAAYTTAANAADVRDIARALGYNRIDVYGISYGTRLAMTLMRDDPSLVRAAVLDSALPPDVLRVNDTAANADEALDTLFADCAADPVCSQTYPDLAQTFDALLTQSAQTPIVVPGTDALGGDQALTLDPAGVVNAAVWGLHISDYIPAVPYAISALQQGDVTSLNPLAAIFSASAPDMNTVVNLAITCHEQILPTTADALNAAFDAHPRTAAFGRLHVFGDPATGIAVCQALGISAATPAELAPLQTDRPSLVLAGGLDPTTPAAYGERAARASSHSTFVLWPTAGHGVSAGPDAHCAQSIISQFLTDPAATPDTACAAETAQRAFLAPGDLAVDVAPAASTSRSLPESGSDAGNDAPSSETAPGGGDAATADGGGGGTDDAGSQLASGEAVVGLLGVPIDECLVCLSHFLGLEPGQLYYDTGLQTGGQVWFLYRADDYDGRIVDIAVAPVPDGTLFVLMLTDPENREGFYSSVYLPTIDQTTAIYWADLESGEPAT